MANLKDKIEQIIIGQFPDAKIELTEVPLSKKLSGHVVTSSFSGVPQRERSRLLWGLLRQNLDAAQQQMLSAILTFSPDEYKVILAYR